MAYTAPTLDQFKTQFLRAFPFAVPSFGATGTVTISGGSLATVTLTAGGNFYVATPLCVLTGGGGTGGEVIATVAANAVTSLSIDSAGSGYTSAPTLTIVSQDGDNTDLGKVTDTDINAAFSMVETNLPNQLIFPNNGQYQTGYNLLAAHYLCTNLLNSTQGVNSQYDWLTSQRTVGNVNTSYAIPKWVREDPFLSTLTATRFGASYISMIANYLRGNVRVVCGMTTP